MSDDEIYEYLGQTFEWNRDKARKNYMQHRVLFTKRRRCSSTRMLFTMATMNIRMKNSGTCSWTFFSATVALCSECYSWRAGPVDQREKCDAT